MLPTPHGVGSIIPPFGRGEDRRSVTAKGTKATKEPDPQPYFAAGSALALPVDLGGDWSVVRRRRLRSRFLAWDRLRLFSRALSFGAIMRDLRGARSHLSSYAVVALRAGKQGACHRRVGFNHRGHGRRRGFPRTFS